MMRLVKPKMVGWSLSCCDIYCLRFLGQGGLFVGRAVFSFLSKSVFTLSVELLVCEDECLLGKKKKRDALYGRDST